jgi:TusA-related sulfurtransferase
VIENARDLLKFLEDDRARRIKALSVLVEGQELEILTDLKMAVNAITEFEHSDGSPIWNSVVERYPRGSKAVGTIVNVIERHGVFVEIEPGITGLIWPSKLPESFWMLDEFSLNERVEVEINNVNASKHRIEMSYLGPYRPSNVDDRDQLTLKMPMFSQTTG